MTLQTHDFDRTDRRFAPRRAQAGDRYADPTSGSGADPNSDHNSGSDMWDAKDEPPVSMVANGAGDDDPVLGGLPRVSMQGRVGNHVPHATNAIIYDSEMLVDAAMERVSHLSEEVDFAVERAREDGLAEGRAQAQKELAQELHRMSRELQETYRTLEDTVVDLALATAKRAVGVQLDPDSTRALVVERLERHRDDDPYVVYVSEQSFRFYADALDAFARAHPRAPRPSLRIDRRLDADRAVLMTKFGSVDLDLATQIEAMRHELEAAV